jgi:hypothetical protein
MMMLIAIPSAGIAAKDNNQETERRICKREIAIGSLVQAKRNCLTKAEWKKAQELNRRNVDEWQKGLDGARRSS